jgi:hypothetical protein
MSDFENRLSALMKQSVGEPPRGVAPHDISRQRPRRAVNMYAASAIGAIVVIAVVALGLFIGLRDNSPTSSVGRASTSLAAPQPRVVTWRGLTLHIPPGWTDVAGEYDPEFQNSTLSFPGYITNESSHPPCQGSNSTRKCDLPVTVLHADGVLISIGFNQLDHVAVGGGAHVAGLPAVVTRGPATDACSIPTGSRTQINAVLAPTASTRLIVLACLGPDASRAQAKVDAMLATATYSPPQ